MPAKPHTGLMAQADLVNNEVASCNVHVRHFFSCQNHTLYDHRNGSIVLPWSDGLRWADGNEGVRPIGCHCRSGTSTSHPSPMAAAVAQQNVSGYVDPLVSKKQQPAKQQKSNPALAHSAKPQTPSEAPQSSTTAQPEQPQNSLAKRDTGAYCRSRGQNSIFAIANAKVAEAQGVPAYAPVRNINPMSGSVFSARTSAAAATSTPMSAGDKNGLW